MKRDWLTVVNVLMASVRFGLKLWMSYFDWIEADETKINRYLLKLKWQLSSA